MVAIPYLFNEIHSIFQNTALYVVVLEAILLLSVVWLILHKRNGRKQFKREKQDEIIENYQPEPLVGFSDSHNTILKTRLVESKVGKMVKIDGHDCINLASHNYLGLLEDKGIENDAATSIRKYGVGSCGPRGFYGTMDVHLELEDRLAKFMRMEEAVVYSYGFSTIASAIPAYSKRGDVIFVDEAVNFSIQKGLDASRSNVFFFKHNDMADLERLLIEQKHRDEKNSRKAAKIRRFLVVEGIYINTGQISPLDKLVALRSKYKLRLFIDESVSFGTLGKSGRGLTEHYGVDHSEIDLISAGMEWAVSSIGGFCVGSHFIVEHQRLSGLGYCFSASLPPFLAQAAISALNKFEKHPEMFADLKKTTSLVHSKFLKLSKLTLCGNELSPVKHLHTTKRYDDKTEQKILIEISNKCISLGVAMVQACYLNIIEKNPMRPSIRLAVNRLLIESEINKAFSVIEKVSNDVLKEAQY